MTCRLFHCIINCFFKDYAGKGWKYTDERKMAGGSKARDRAGGKGVVFAGGAFCGLLYDAVYLWRHAMGIFIFCGAGKRSVYRGGILSSLRTDRTAGDLRSDYCDFGGRLGSGQLLYCSVSRESDFALGSDRFANGCGRVRQLSFQSYLEDGPGPVFGGGG